MKYIKNPRIYRTASVIIVLMLCMMFAGQLHAAQPPHKTRYPFGIDFVKARPEQYIFLVPANFAGTVLTAISAFVAWPFSAAWNAAHDHIERRDLIPPVPWASNTIGLAGAYIVGSPFWCLEQALWEFPVWLFSDEKPKEPETINDSSYRIGTGI